MKLKKIYKILSFKQSDWLKVFTYFNTEKRRLSNDEFKYKLLNNCIYVKVLKMQGKKLM